MLAFARAVSIEIESHAVKVAQLVESRGRIRAVRFAEHPLPADYRWEVGADRQPVVEAIRRALTRAGIRARKAVIALPRRQVTARISPFPPADRSDLERVVGYDLADHIPFPVDQVVVDLQTLGPSREEPGLTDVLVVAAQRELIREYLGVAEELGLRLTALAVDALALDDLTRLVEAEPAGATVTVAIGRRATTINISEQGRLRLTRSIGLAAQQLTRAVQEDLGVTADEAQRVMWAQGLRLLDREPRPPRIAAWLDNLLGDIRRSALSFGPAAVSRIMLAGAEAELPGLKEAIQAEFGVEPTRLDAAELFPQAELSGESAQTSDRCLVAIGQGLRSVGRSAWTISLLPREVLQARRARRLRRVGALAAVLAVAGMAGAYMLAARTLARRTETVSQLREKARAAAAQRAYAEELDAERERFRAQLGALEPARLSRYAALELLNTIAFYAPDEIVLSRFTLQPDRSLEVRGSAPSSAVAADLQQALGGSPLVANAQLLNVADITKGGQKRQAVTFSLRAELGIQRKAASRATVLADRRGGT
ncbi:MAG: type IV pilus assembly protein PilM [Armatimonadota bacterium]|nr:MAG: type IV pilus assembly protein PilM [Armatimonadota bacterium]